MDTPLIYAFDALGTLFDVHSPARVCAELIGDGWPRLTEIWRSKQLEYAFIHAALDQSIPSPPFRELTRHGLVYALTLCGHDPHLAPRILSEYRKLELFSDVGENLTALKRRGARLAILSNGDPDMLDDLVDNSKLRTLFEALISVRAAGTFKPSPRVYALVTEHFSARPEEISFVSSNRWDIAGAAAFGFETIWLKRANVPDEYTQHPPKRVIHGLAELL